MKKLAKLYLSNGKTFSGWLPQGSSEFSSGEVVFTTGMTGYEESLTDPSYTGQILVFTYPLIGNYGILPKERWESEKIQAVGVVISEGCENWSHSEGMQSLFDWLKAQEIPVICDVDTRALTKELRDSGVMLGAISTQPAAPETFDDPNKRCLQLEVGTRKPVVEREGKKRVIVVDQGMKGAILKFLKRYDFTIVRVPFDYDYTLEPYDAVFYSNGPGDPSLLQNSVAVLQKAMEKKKPIFGVCLGVQILALAAGAKTYKLPYGHRGHNQPCQEVDSGKCFITSQNHGFAIDPKSLPKGWKVTFRNLNDKTIEGISHETLPFSAVQFHPEATPGPTDTQWIFDAFAKVVEKTR